MDFAICPSCGQSVLDDDAEDCPFCGSSMKAKPGQAKPTPKPSGKAPAPAAAPAAGKPASAKSPAARPPGKPAVDDDSPFSAAEEAERLVPVAQASPTPTKGKSHEVRCPMCETVGYVSKGAIGKPVKCANPKCLVPVFEVPPEPEAPPPPPPPKRNNLIPIAIATVLVVGVLGGAAYFLAMQPSTTAPVVTQIDPDILKSMNGDTDRPKNTETPKPAVEPVKPDQSVETVKVTPAKEWIEKALQQMVDSSTALRSQNRSKPFCRQQAAIGYALVGDIAAAQGQVEQLLKVGPEVPYYRIPCLTAIAWQELSKGASDAAVKSVATAFQDVARLPKVGRSQLEDASGLAAVLVATGRADDALKLLNQRQKSTLEAETAAALQIVRAARTFDLDEWYAKRPLSTWVAPQSAAAVASLVAHGKDDEAWKFAEQQTSADARADCLVELCRQLALQGRSQSPEGLIKKLESHGPAITIHGMAMHALGLRVRAPDADIASFVQKASEIAESLTPPAEPRLPDTKGVIDLKLSAPAPLVQSAVALGQLCQLQAAAGQPVPAAARLERSLQFARGMAPALDGVVELARQTQQTSAGILQNQLRQELKLKTDDDARLTTNAYRRNVDQLDAAARQSTLLQGEILKRAVGWGLAEPVWDIVSLRTTDDDVANRVNFMTTEVPAVLIEAFRRGNQSEKLNAVLALWKQLQQTDAPPRPELVQFEELLAAGEATRCARQLSELDSVDTRRDEWAHVLAAQQVKSHGAAAAFGFISQLSDIVLREECYELAASLAALRGQAPDVWKQVQAVNSATEKVALCRGLIAGLTSPSATP